MKKQYLRREAFNIALLLPEDRQAAQEVMAQVSELLDWQCAKTSFRLTLIRPMQALVEATPLREMEKITTKLKTAGRYAAVLGTIALIGLVIDYIPPATNTAGASTPLCRPDMYEPKIVKFDWLKGTTKYHSLKNHISENLQ